MRVLHVYAGNLYGGIERLLATLAEYRHAESRLTQDFALCFRGRIWDELESLGVSPFDLGAVRLRNPFSVFFARRRLAKLLRNQAYDIVITHACWPHVVFAPIVRRAKVGLVNWVHDSLKGQHRIERSAGKTRPAHLIVNSHHTAESVDAVFPEVPKTVIYCPIAEPNKPAADVRQSMRRSLGSSDATKVILQVSRMEAWKGQRVLLEALGRMQANRNWELWLAGGAQRPSEIAYETELKNLASKLGIVERVKFLGHRTDVPNLMAAADLFCQPNVSPEPFGIVFVEALYASLPVISSNFGGVSEIVDDSCGLLVTPNDPDSLAEYLSKLLNDETRCRQLALAGPAKAKRLCDPISRLKQLANTLESVVF